MDLVGKIRDPKIKIKPSQKLLDYIINLHIKEVPENIFEINKIKDTKSNLSIISNTSNLLKPALTTEEVNTIRTLEEEFPLTETQLKTVHAALFKMQITKEYSDSGNHCDLLNLNDLVWLSNIIVEQNKSSKSKTYLHELLPGSVLILPENEIVKRNPELEERCVKLRSQQQAREYHDMTRNVDNTRKFEPQDTIAYQTNQIKRQMIAVLQFVFSVLAGFAFGFIGLELMFGNLDFGFRLLMGIMCSLIIALAEIYFLAKELSVEDVVVKEIPLKPFDNFVGEDFNLDKPLQDNEQKKDKLNKKND